MSHAQAPVAPQPGAPTAPQTTERGDPPAPPVPPPILNSQPTLGVLLAAFRRRWRLATSLGLLVGALAAAAAWYFTGSSSFTASTLLRVDSNLPRVLFD